MSIPVQCTQEIPTYFHEKPQPLAAAAHNPAAQRGLDYLSRHMGAFSNLLAEDMAKLSVGMPQRKEDTELEHKAAPLLTLDSLKVQEDSECKTPRKSSHHGTDMAVHALKVGVFTFTPQCPACGQGFSMIFLTNSLSCPLCVSDAVDGHPLVGRRLPPV